MGSVDHLPREVTLDHTAAWENSEVLACFSGGDLFKVLHNSDGDAEAVLVVWWCLPRAGQALTLMLVINSKAGNKVQVRPTV